ncbi:hypothetical protein KsCSTR_33060 [Candidatus Kuenenia stuttgartiensis]|uniref:Uncharacterized protein n=1 Tax=Kuenenia stuttgartiensis TaxID=174633 RepID=Q1Q4I9_KUEST|nr:hypothetical protein KsCSTR_33060 [Candidatus Kuenenia stuttgartiensis]CAJ74924.1 unknown protein [Candidatus Kuenenia stuttgartiensis]
MLVSGFVIFAQCFVIAKAGAKHLLQIVINAFIAKLVNASPLPSLHIHISKCMLHRQRSESSTLKNRVCPCHPSPQS